MADPESLTIAILREIRDEIRATRGDLLARIDQTNERLDRTNERLDQTVDRLDHVETALVDLAEQQRFIVRHLTANTGRDRAIEKEFDKLRKRVDKLEAKREVRKR